MDVADLPGGAGVLRDADGELGMTCGGKDSEHVAVADQQQAACRFCGQAIFWGKTNAGKNAPADPSTGRNHWITCPNQGDARKAYPRTEKML